MERKIFAQELEFTPLRSFPVFVYFVSPSFRVFHHRIPFYAFPLSEITHALLHFSTSSTINLSIRIPIYISIHISTLSTLFIRSLTARKPPSHRTRARDIRADEEADKEPPIHELALPYINQQ